MLHIHPNAGTTPATRAETARSVAFSAIVAQRYGISAETVRKWQMRGAADCLDRSALPHQRGLLADTGSTLAGPPKLPPARYGRQAQSRLDERRLSSAGTAPRTSTGLKPCHDRRCSPARV